MESTDQPKVVTAYRTLTLHHIGPTTVDNIIFRFFLTVPKLGLCFKMLLRRRNALPLTNDDTTSEPIGNSKIIGRWKSRSVDDGRKKGA
ncbi:hypothetical protein OUZ56_001559 [Daphnia magna]|uniref:Uncharacterized protein n=1 Tax=Daphnia magna TaxID=35525 RepID=A0ABR0A3I4_9CRUS|nr:hypothetical protein OUZ56_001559 [Daphnia magna]